MWSTFSKVTKFSILGFIISGALGLFSMGVLGYGLYYTVSPVLGDRIDELQGDATWPSLILAGMAWSIAFLLAGGFYSWLSKRNFPSGILYLSYALVLWIWALVVWYAIIDFRIVS
ncbi:MAG: hypothetical protein RIF39_11470 [Cyclobacteriaceae bacterium]